MLAGSIVAIVTPFHSNGEIDEDQFRSLINWHCQAGTNGIVVAGTTGESAAMSINEIKRLVEIALEEANARVPVIVGNGAIGTEKTIAITQSFNDLPIAGFLTVTPYYVKPSQSGLKKHFTAVADSAAHPIYLYNVPGRTGCDLLDETALELAQHPNIAGIKDATGDLSRAKELIAQKPSQFAVLSGDDATSQAFMELGGDGVISVTANVVPELMAKRCQLNLEGNYSSGREIDSKIAALHNDLFVEANPIPIKWCLAKMNKIENNLRLPLTPLEQGKQKLGDIIKQLSLSD